jgi:hypothetical protein
MCLRGLHSTNFWVEQPKLSQTCKIHEQGGVKLIRSLVHFGGATEEVLRLLGFASLAFPNRYLPRNQIIYPRMPPDKPKRSATEALSVFFLPVRILYRWSPKSKQLGTPPPPSLARSLPCREALAGPPSLQRPCSSPPFLLPSNPLHPPFNLCPLRPCFVKRY